MAYDEKLAEKIRKQVKGKRGITEIKMFGGLCFMVRGNMACGVEKNSLVVRVGPEKYQEALKRPNARPFDLTGRPLTAPPPPPDSLPTNMQPVNSGMAVSRPYTAPPLVRH